MARTEILTTAVESSRGVLPILNELSRLRRYGRPYFLAAPALIAMTLISRAAEAASVGLIVLFLQAALGDGLGEEPAEGVVRALSEWVDAATGGSLPVLGAAIGLAVLVRILSDVVIGLVDSRAYAQISHAVRRDIHAQYFDVEFNYVASHDHADLINVVENESENVPEAFQAVLEIAQEAAAVLIFGVMVFLLSWQVGLIAGAGAALLVAVSHLLAAPIQRLNARAISQHRMLIQRVLIGLQGMRAIRAFAQEPAEKQRFGRASRRLGATHRRIDVLETWIDPINELGYLALMAAIVVAGLWFGPGASGTVAVLALLYRLQPHASALQSLAIKLVTMTPHLSMVRTVLGRKDKSYPPSGEQGFERLNREIAFEAVSMAYPGSKDAVLRDASFSIPAGRTTALLGPSGAGKTTVVNLLLGLYQPTSGAVLVDGTPLPALRRPDWLHRIAVAGQDVELIEGSVAANVRLSRPSASAAAVCEACRIAGILDDIESLPDGFATWIGERGARLSGGQRQRLGLARALLCDPDVLILDEATSALDDTLEQAIRTRLLRELEGRTIVLITHRLSTVAQVDHAVWLEGGRVVEEGAPRSLGRLKRASGEARRSPEIS